MKKWFQGFFFYEKREGAAGVCKKKGRGKETGNEGFFFFNRECFFEETSCLWGLLGSLVRASSHGRRTAPPLPPGRREAAPLPTSPGMMLTVYCFCAQAESLQVSANARSISDTTQKEESKQHHPTEKGGGKSHPQEEKEGNTTKRRRKKQQHHPTE